MAPLKACRACLRVTWRERDFGSWCLEDHLQIRGLGTSCLFPHYDTNFIFPQQPIHLTAQVVHTTNAELRNVLGEKWRKGQAFLLNSRKITQYINHQITAYVFCVYVYRGVIPTWSQCSQTAQLAGILPYPWGSWLHQSHLMIHSIPVSRGNHTFTLQSRGIF